MAFFSSIKRPWFGWLCTLLLLAACSEKGTSRSELFQEIFTTRESGTFRGVTLGESIEQARAQEAPNLPVHEDVLGLTYHFDLGQERSLVIAYYKDNLKTQRETNRLASIVANVHLNDELTTAQLYNEIQDYFIQNNHYGLASGSYGDYIWESRLKNGMEVRLKLDENKHLITLNFIDTQIQRSMPE